MALRIVDVKTPIKPAGAKPDRPTVAVLGRLACGRSKRRGTPTAAAALRARPGSFARALAVRAGLLTPAVEGSAEEAEPITPENTQDVVAGELIAM